VVVRVVSRKVELDAHFTSFLLPILLRRIRSASWQPYLPQYIQQNLRNRQPTITPICSREIYLNLLELFWTNDMLCAHAAQPVEGWGRNISEGVKERRFQVCLVLPYTYFRDAGKFPTFHPQMFHFNHTQTNERISSDHQVLGKSRTSDCADQRAGQKPARCRSGRIISMIVC
jgi:hypothetical protein